LGSFSRAQVSSALATTVDFGLLFGLVEHAGVWYVAATAIGTLAGGITNFLVNRYWTFRASHKVWHEQAFRYAIISVSSMLLNAGGVWAVTEWFGVHYSVSVVVVSALVGLLFNFPLHRHYVFSHKR